MENPCKTCIVRANCTEVCPAKINYKKLLEFAIDSHKDHFTFRKKYLHFLRLQRDNTAEISKIKLRKSGIESL
jgi:L-lactate utilization protein LutB